MRCLPGVNQSFFLTLSAGSLGTVAKRCSRLETLYHSYWLASKEHATSICNDFYYYLAFPILYDSDAPTLIYYGSSCYSSQTNKLVGASQLDCTASQLDCTATPHVSAARRLGTRPSVSYHIGSLGCNLSKPQLPHSWNDVGLLSSTGSHPCLRRPD